MSIDDVAADGSEATDQFFVLNDDTLAIEPASEEEWRRWFARRDHSGAHHIDKTIVTSDVWVATVFVGYSHGGTPPSVFWTHVFGGPLNELLLTSSTFGKAKRLHWSIVQKCRIAIELGQVSEADCDDEIGNRPT